MAASQDDSPGITIQDRALFAVQPLRVGRHHLHKAIQFPQQAGVSHLWRAEHPAEECDWVACFIIPREVGDPTNAIERCVNGDLNWLIRGADKECVKLAYLDYDLPHEPLFPGCQLLLPRRGIHGGHQWSEKSAQAADKR